MRVVSHRPQVLRALAGWWVAAVLLVLVLMHQVNQVQVNQVFHLSIKPRTNHQFYFLQ